MKPEALIFDFDGVLVDSVGIKKNAFCEVYSKYGEFICSKICKHHLDHGGLSRFEKFKYYHKQFLGKKIDKSEIHDMNLKFSKFVKEKIINSKEISGATDLLKKLHEIIHIHLLSATPDEELKEIIKSRNMNQYFISVNGYPPDKLYHINKIIKKHNYNRNKIFFVGDSISDYKAAINSKIHFIGFSNTGKNIFPEECNFIQNLSLLYNMIVYTS